MSEIESQVQIELRAILASDAEALKKFLIKYDASIEIRLGHKQILYVELDSPNFHFIMEV